MTMKTDQRIRAAYEPVGAPGEPLDQPTNHEVYLGNKLEGCSAQMITQALRDARLEALRAAGAARRPQPLMIDRDADLRRELRTYLDTLTITGETIGDIRRSLFVPWDSLWNGWVRDETAQRETRAAGAPADSAGPQEKEMQFRKKPVVIEAEQFFDDKPLPFRNHGVVMFDGDEGRFYIQTLEGALTVSNGDWVIRGVKGEFYPCKPDIFAATYEPAADGAGTAQRTGDEVI